MIWLLLVASNRGRIYWWVLAGTCIGLSVINRGGSLLFIPIVLFWIYMLDRWQRQQGMRCDRMNKVVNVRFLKRVTGLLLPVGLLILPVSWYNVKYDIPSPLAATNKPVTSSLSATATKAEEPFFNTFRRFISGRFLRLGAVSGYNFYLGNYWELREINNPNHPLFLPTLARIDEEPRSNGVQTAFGYSRYLFRKTIHHIAENPVNWIKLMSLKLNISPATVR